MVVFRDHGADDLIVPEKWSVVKAIQIGNSSINDSEIHWDRCINIKGTNGLCRIDTLEMLMTL